MLGLKELRFLCIYLAMAQCWNLKEQIETPGSLPLDYGMMLGPKKFKIHVYLPQNYDLVLGLEKIFTTRVQHSTGNERVNTSGCWLHGAGTERKEALGCSPRDNGIVLELR